MRLVSFRSSEIELMLLTEIDKNNQQIDFFDDPDLITGKIGDNSEIDKNEVIEALKRENMGLKTAIGMVNKFAKDKQKALDVLNTKERKHFYSIVKVLHLISKLKFW